MVRIEKSLVSLNQDIAGQSIGIPVYYLSPEHPVQRTVYIQSAVHAAEMQGSAVILKLIEQFRQLKLNANFILVPNCNPFGRTQRAGEYLQGRFDATNGNNWNRFYHYQAEEIEGFYQALSEPLKSELASEQSNKQNTIEQTIVAQLREFMRSKLSAKLESEWGINTAQYLNIKLQLLAVDAELVLDLHTGPSSTRHIYSPTFLAKKAQLFNIENILSIPESFAGALDEASFMPSVKLAELFAAEGAEFNYRTEAFTVELGSQENISLAQAELDAAGILNYLQHNGYVDGVAQQTRKAVITTELKDYKTLYSAHAGMVEYLAKPGEQVEQGQVLARVLNSLEFDNDNAITEIRSPAAGTVILHYPSAAVQVGTQLYKIAM